LANTQVSRPNIIVILCDDLGYGDVSCNYRAGKIRTPQLDRLAAEGMRITDAHTTSSVCTPTRYSLLTGRHNWRSKLQQGVIGGLSPMLIEPGRLTLAELLKNQGYRTACIGKWHLGLNWRRREGAAIPELTIEETKHEQGVDFTAPIVRGPLQVGFDYYFGTRETLNNAKTSFSS
jgi:arylsulfatase A-like enzyme